MQLDGFVDLSKQEQKNICGSGFGALVLIFVPLIINSIGNLLGSIKGFISDKGSISTKGKDMTSTWDNHESVLEKKSSKSHEHTFYYVN